MSPAMSEQSYASAISRQSESPERRVVSAAPVRPSNAAGPSQSRTPAKRRAFLDFLAKVDGAESEEEEAYQNDLSGSMGSLRDFIVDDDDEVDYQSGISGDDVDSEMDDASDAVAVDRKPKLDMASDVEVDEATSHVPKTELLDLDSDSDIAIVKEEVVSRPRSAEATKPTIFAEFIDSDDDEDNLVEASDVDDILSSAIDKLDLETGGSSRTRTKGKKAIKSPKWALERVRIAQEVFDDLDKRVFDSRLGDKGAGATIVWNKRLLTTAGTAHRKK